MRWFKWEGALLPDLSLRPGLRRYFAELRAAGKQVHVAYSGAYTTESIRTAVELGLGMHSDDRVADVLLKIVRGTTVEHFLAMFVDRKGGALCGGNPFAVVPLYGCNNTAAYSGCVLLLGCSASAEHCGACAVMSEMAAASPYSGHQTARLLAQQVAVRWASGFDPNYTPTLTTMQIASDVHSLSSQDGRTTGELRELAEQYGLGLRFVGFPRTL